jgi:hypothetical protein
LAEDEDVIRCQAKLGGSPAKMITKVRCTIDPVTAATRLSASAPAGAYLRNGFNPLFKPR